MDRPELAEGDPRGCSVSEDVGRRLYPHRTASVRSPGRDVEGVTVLSQLVGSFSHQPAHDWHGGPGPSREEEVDVASAPEECMSRDRPVVLQRRLHGQTNPVQHELELEKAGVGQYGGEFVHRSIKSLAPADHL